MKINTQVTVDDYPGVYEVAQPIGPDSFVHLRPTDNVARERVPVSLIVPLSMCWDVDN